MKRYKMSWRMGLDAVIDPVQFGELLDSLQAGTPDSCADEFWIFISEPTSYGYEPLELIAEKCERFKPVMAQIRARGLKVGINPWPSFGAGEEYRVEIPPVEMPFPHMVDTDGKVAPRLACPVSDGFLAYTKERYKLFAKTGCDFVWVDDDCRFTHLESVDYPCFCPDCVRKFQNGAWPDRETLVAALNAPENGALREAWCEYGGARLAKYCAAVREAVDEVDPAIETPFMSVGYNHTSFSGNYIEQCIKALRAKETRPGHGFWSDAAPLEMFEKTMEMGRQVVDMPNAETLDIEYEEESHPSTQLNKTLHTRRMELALSIWGGCNAVAFNHVPGCAGPHFFAHEANEVKLLSALRPYYDQYLTFVDGLPQQGLWGAYTQWRAARMAVDEKGWFRETDPDYNTNVFVKEWPCFGFPVTCNPSGAWGTILQGKTAEVLTDAELDEIFKKPVILDGMGLEILWKRGYGEKTGVRVKSAYGGGVESLADSPYTAPFTGAIRYSLEGLSYNLEPVADGVEVLAYTTRPYGFKDEINAAKYGNVVVLGFAPYQYTGTVGYMQLRRNLHRALGAYAWLCPDDAYQPPRVSCWVRGDDRRAALLLINSQNDTAQAFAAICRCSASKAVFAAPGKPPITLTVTREDGYARVELPAMNAWDMGILYLD